MRALHLRLPGRGRTLRNRRGDAGRRRADGDRGAGRISFDARGTDCLGNQDCGNPQDGETQPHRMRLSLPATGTRQRREIKLARLALQRLSSRWSELFGALESAQAEGVALPLPIEPDPGGTRLSSLPRQGPPRTCSSTSSACRRPTNADQRDADRPPDQARRSAESAALCSGCFMVNQP
jgi:hypothetical protein